MASLLCVFLPLLALAVALDIFFVTGLNRLRKLKKEYIEKEGSLKIKKWELYRQAFFRNTDNGRSSRLTRYALEWLFIILIASLYSGKTLLNFEADKLQQSGEQPESATLPLLAEIGLWRYKEVPLWNPYMLTGYPHTGDTLGHFWNPVATIPVILWGGINGMKVSIYLTFILAGLGQWAFAYVLKLRRMFRLWSSILFTISGGLALLWRLGWYELLLGAAWFPWCFATYLYALKKGTWRSIFLASAAIFMVISTGGGYYPFYLLGCMMTLFVIMMLRVSPDQR